MSTYRELIYMVLDKVKESTDDAYFKEEHVAFLMDKYRPFILKQRYADVRKSISQNNYSIFKLELNRNDGNLDDLGYTFKYTTTGIIYGSTIAMPKIVSFNDDIEEFKIFNFGETSNGDKQFIGDFSIVNKERFKYVGSNKWLKKFLYATIGPDYFLYLKVNDNTIVLPQYILVQAIVETPKQHMGLILPTVTNYLDMVYPLEEALVPPLLELVVKDLVDGTYRPEDTVNNATDDLAKTAAKIAQQR